MPAMIEPVAVACHDVRLGEVQAGEQVVVIGGGPIGMEMAQAHLRLGSKVKVIEGAKALGKDDPEMAAIVLDKVREQNPEAFAAAVSGVERDFVAGHDQAQAGDD